MCIYLFKYLCHANLPYAFRRHSPTSLRTPLRTPCHEGKQWPWRAASTPLDCRGVLIQGLRKGVRRGNHKGVREGVRRGASSTCSKSLLYIIYA